MPTRLLSFNNLIAKLLPHMPPKLVWLVSKKYIAGAKLEDAIKVIRELNSHKIKATADVLGEAIENIQDANNYQKIYLETILAAEKFGLNTTFSLKPTMFGLQINYEQCKTLIKEIVKLAASKNFFVRIDMEDSSCTDTELKLFSELYSEFPENVGIVIQAYLHRSLTDIENLAKISKPNSPINVRLCKGIYVESKNIAYKLGHEINKNFIACLNLLLEKSLYPAIATHDKYLIRSSVKVLYANNKKEAEYEFQMLFGVTPRLRQKLASAGHQMRVYVPFGEEWFRYSTRRLQENPKMVWDIIFGMFSNK